MTDPQASKSSKKAGSEPAESTQTALSALSKAIKDFKEIIAAIIFLIGALIAGYSYFAPASVVKQLGCALDNQRFLTIAGDAQINNFRDKISAQESENMLTDFLLLLVVEDGDSEELRRFKKRLSTELKPKIALARAEITSLEVHAAAINENIRTLEQKISRRECSRE